MVDTRGIRGRGSGGRICRRRFVNGKGRRIHGHGHGVRSGQTYNYRKMGLLFPMVTRYILVWP